MNGEFTYKTSLRLRGIACILVILHHLAEYVPALAFFANLGFLPVGIFLFGTGYGLITKYKSDGASYLKKLILVRVPYIIIAYLVANAVYLAVGLATDTMIKTTLTGFLFGGGALVTYSWYIILALFLYVSFYLSYRLFKNPALLLLLSAAWIVCMFVIGSGLHRAATVPCFFLGILAGAGDRIKKILFSRGSMAVTLVLFAAAFGAYCILSVGRLYALLLGVVFSAAFAVFSAALFVRLNKITAVGFLEKIGKISLELYLYQGAAIILSCMTSENRGVVFVISVFIITALFAAAVNCLTGHIMNGWKSIPAVRERCALVDKTGEK